MITITRDHRRPSFQSPRWSYTFEEEGLDVDEFACALRKIMTLAGYLDSQVQLVFSPKLLKQWGYDQGGEEPWDAPGSMRPAKTKEPTCVRCQKEPALLCNACAYAMYYSEDTVGLRAQAMYMLEGHDKGYVSATWWEDLRAALGQDKGKV